MVREKIVKYLQKTLRNGYISWRTVVLLIPCVSHLRPPSFLSLHTHVNSLHYRQCDTQIDFNFH